LFHGLLFIQRQTCHKDRSPAIRHPPTCPVATQASGRPPLTGDGGDDVLRHQRGTRRARTCPLDGLQPARDAPTGHTTALSNQDCSTPIPLTWTDEDPELEKTSAVGARPSEDVPAAAREWPPLPPPAVGFHDVHNSQPRPILSTVDTDETPVHNDNSTDSRTEHVPADLVRTGTTRKKLQVDKIGETSLDRKRNRTRTRVSSKEKY
jgi:hypothetical protein